MKYLIPVMLLFGGCGGQYQLKEPDNPIEITVKHSFAFDEIVDAFRWLCKEENPSFTDYEIEQCANVKLAELLTGIGATQ